MIEKNELRFVLLAGCIRNTIPQQIEARGGTPPLMDRNYQRPQRSLFDYAADDFNTVERDFVLYLDSQQWVVGWIRNFARTGYGIQGWKPNKVYPDFMVLAGQEQPYLPEFSRVYVLDTKGLHLKGNEDTEYKQELFELCNELCEPKPWDEVRQQFAAHETHYKVVFEDEWMGVINAMNCEQSES